MPRRMPGRSSRSPATIVAHDARPLTEARAAGERQVGVCRHFTLLHVAMLRRKGVPARARCGFGAYFEKGKFSTTGSPNTGTRPQALGAGRCPARRPAARAVQDRLRSARRAARPVPGGGRRLAALPRRQGRSRAPSASSTCTGLWFIASNVVRDVAALNNHEMLPWDVWGADDPRRHRDRPRPYRQPGRADARSRRALRRAARDLRQGPRVAVPATVFNAVLNRPEAA